MRGDAVLHLLRGYRSATRVGFAQRGLGFRRGGGGWDGGGRGGETGDGRKEIGDDVRIVLELRVARPNGLTARVVTCTPTLSR